MPTFGLDSRGLIALFLSCFISVVDANSTPKDIFSLSLAELVETKVTVASLSEETLSQTPVPVSVITATMITQSGATSLKQLLLTYVPGFTNVADQNEVNVAARGIFTSSQQKVLILLNGHRLNSRSYSMAAPDHSISLDKVKQIEILRGPASALYGNVSLTATVNIILKSTNDIPENQVSMLAGNYGQRGISILSSAMNDSWQAVGWFNSFKSQGEKINLHPHDTYVIVPQEKNQVILDGFRDRDPYDAGVHFTSGEYKLLLNARRAHYIEPYTAGGLSGEPYHYEAYKKFGGYGAGIGYEAQHVEFSTQNNIANWQINSALYWDSTMLKSGLVIDPAIHSFGGPTWSDSNWGLLSTMQKELNNYRLLLGTQLEYYKVSDAAFPIGINSVNVNGAIDNMLPEGSESSYSIFGQINQPLNENWHANIGFRYDIKNRKRTENIDQLSPRIGLVYDSKHTNIKLSYAESFVDATYWNRFSTLPSFKGAADLKPERLRSFQISPSWKFQNLNAQATTNIFYDQSIDVIYRNNAAKEDNYSNAGKLYTWGIEQEFSYAKGNWQIRANATYRAAVQSELIAIDNHYINNVPKLTANIIVDKTLSAKHSLHVAARYIGRQFSPILIQQDGRRVDDPFPDKGVSYYAPHHYVEDAWLVNANYQWKVSSRFTVNLQIKNLLNQKHYQGGSTLHPYQQPSRWFHLKATVRF